MVGEVATRIDVEVLGRDDVLVTEVPGQVLVDRQGQRSTAGHRQRATLAEVFLYVDDDQRPHGVHPSQPSFVGPRGLFADAPGNQAAMVLRRIARPLLSVAFIGQGANSLLNPKAAAEAAAPAVDGLQSLPDPVRSNVPSDPETVARITAAVQVGGGLLLATGKLPRVASAALALTVLPANLGTHTFWNEPDPEIKAQKRQQFLTDLSLVGGLLIASADTAGKPSLGWRGRRAAERLSERVSSALPGSDDPDFGDLGEKIVHGLQVGAERGRELASTAAERGAPYAEAALERGRELAGTAAERGAPLAKKARKRGEELVSTAADRSAPLAKKARKRSENLPRRPASGARSGPAPRVSAAANSRTPRSRAAPSGSTPPESGLATKSTLPCSGAFGDPRGCGQECGYDIPRIVNRAEVDGDAALVGTKRFQSVELRLQ